MKSKAPTRLSKSRILSGLQCERRLWLESLRRDLLDIDDGQQRQFNIGNDVGELARDLYGPGVLVDAAKEAFHAWKSGAHRFQTATTNQPPENSARRFLTRLRCGRLAQQVTESRQR